MEKGSRALVSLVRGYKEHHCKFVFRLQVGLAYCVCVCVRGGAHDVGGEEGEPYTDKGASHAPACHGCHVVCFTPLGQQQLAYHGPF